jgi:tetratricopeptide (TPR) repeat protein
MSLHGEATRDGWAWTARLRPGRSRPSAGTMTLPSIGLTIILAGPSSVQARRDRVDIDERMVEERSDFSLASTAVAARHDGGFAMDDQDRFDAAIARITEEIRLNPKDASAYKRRGILWFLKKEYDRAISDDDEAIRLDPGVAQCFTNRGRARYAKKEYAKALADYDEAIRIEPTHPFSYNNRAWIRATCQDSKYRDGTKALESATRACELADWEGAYALGTLAAACAEVGDFDAAVKWQTRANAVYYDAEDERMGEERLSLYREKKPYHEKAPYRL